jgi:hypothetical protein
LTLGTRQSNVDAIPPLPARLGDLIDHVLALHPDGEPLTRLADAMLTAGQLGEVSDHLVGHFVDQARRSGASWTDIGQSLGVTKQAAQQRFVPRAAEVDPDLAAGGRLARFTPRARFVLVQAQDEARRAGNPTVEPSHIVLGLLADRDAVAAQAIRAQGVAPETVRAAVVAELPPASPDLPANIAFAPNARRLLGLTLREALHLEHNYIGTEHVLLAVLSEPDSPAGRQLRAAGIDPDATRGWIEATLADLARRRAAGE